MKFPLRERPFPPLELSGDQCDAFEHTATAVLHETIAEYDHFVHKQNRTMDKKRWKVVKTRENVTVYKKRDREDAVSVPSPQQHHPDEDSRAKAGSCTSNTSSTSSTRSFGPSTSATTDWSLPKLLAVGSIVGNLDDVMYGIVSPDADCAKVKSTYVDDELVDSRVLHAIRGATVEDPYRFLGIKWFVMAHPAGVMWPRDAVFVEGTGTHVQPNGDKIGYHLMHSVELPQCRELTDLGILRGQFSSCYLFKQLPNGTVEVFMKSFVAPAGKVPEVVAIKSAANGLIACWKSVWCAQNKKLAWLMRGAIAAARQQSRARGHDGSRTTTMKTNAQGKHCCALCDQTFSAFRTAVTCELCHATVCSKCKTARKLTYVYGGKEVRKIPTAFCKNCITTANHTSSAEIARYEYVAGALERRRRTAVSTSSSVCSSSSATRVSYYAEPAGRSVHKPSDEWKGGGSMAGTESSSVATSWSLADESNMYIVDDAPLEDRESIEIDTVDDWEHRHATPLDPQQQLWLQMNQLCLQAELAFETTRQNNEAMAHGLRR